jgi:hypothetical protein
MAKYQASFSLLDMLPELREATSEFINYKQNNKSRRHSRRRLQESPDADATIVNDNDNGNEIADEDEIIIDPKEMPNDWDDSSDTSFIDPIRNDDSECVSVLVDITNNFMSYNDTVMHIFRNSGKDYNDFGRYEDCNDIHHFNYFMITVLKKFPIPFTMGLCLP